MGVYGRWELDAKPTRFHILRDASGLGRKMFVDQQAWNDCLGEGGLIAWGRKLAFRA
ncbi:MAG: hypothetical protein H6R21_1858 [Proteobacteria bacterium]|nr:hypothetical protein [Pseudomonadota bacterium]